jgi:energy-coupling factor transport system ATP-binding protein
VTELRLEHVSFAYPGGVQALTSLDLVVPAGQALAIIGANGSGKSTLARLLDGLLRPSAGRVLLDGRDARERTVARLAAEVALCLQRPDHQIFKGTVRDEVVFGPRQRGASDEEAFARAREALERVGLGQHLEKHPDDLGEAHRKLLTVAGVLAMDTPVVVLDEPTTGLDARGIARIADIVGSLRAAGRTVIGISHDLRFVAEAFERILVLREGAPLLDGTPAEVFAEPHWPELRSAGLEPPEAALIGARLGLGSTPTDAHVVDALRRRHRAERAAPARPAPGR